MANAKNLNLTADSSQSKSGVWPQLISKSRIVDTSFVKESITLPSTNKIEMILFKETAKIERQKVLMKNVMKNKIDQDRRNYELKDKLKEKEKKHKEALKLNKYENQVLKNKRDEKMV